MPEEAVLEEAQPEEARLTGVTTLIQRGAIVGDD
jgi:hypothetical protein